MLSTTHEILVRLFDERPQLAAELLRQCLDVPLPPYRRARVEKQNLTQVRPVAFHADLVVSYDNRAPAFAVIVEVQLKTNRRKRFTWPVYVASVRARLKCPVVLLVVTPSPRVAGWAREPIVLGPGSACTPVVLGPGTVPVVTRRNEAIDNPELAVLSAMAHGRGDYRQALRIAKVGATSAKRLDDDTALLYFTAIREALGPVARKAFEMIPDVERFLDSKTRKRIQKARAEGKAEGKAEAVQAKRDAVLAVLQARGLTLTDRQRARIGACTSVTKLDVWHRRAVTASTTTVVFGKGPLRAGRASAGSSNTTRR